MARKQMSTANRFGIPYMGSKNGIAPWVVQHLPSARHFYDVFAGGCAITHCALLVGRWEQFHINDISNSVELFINAINGKYHNESRWISREDFFKLKDTDPYVRLVWSFGNNSNVYVYGKDIEELKHALHDVHFAKTPEERQEAMSRYRREFSRIRGREIKEANRLGSLERLQRLQSLESLQTRKDYRELTFEDDAVIYCDPPYKDTEGYNGEDFDHDAFYAWCLEQTQPLFISEYNMPQGDFICVAERKKNALMGRAIDTRKKVTEKIYRPRKQVTG